MKLKIDIDCDSGNLIQSLATACSLTVSEVIDRLISGHLSELWELRTLMESPGLDTETLDQASNLLVSYGAGETIIAGIHRIAPEYTTLEARFIRDIEAPSNHARTAL